MQIRGGYNATDAKLMTTAERSSQVVHGEKAGQKIRDSKNEPREAESCDNSEFQSPAQEAPLGIRDGHNGAEGML